MSLAIRTANSALPKNTTSVLRVTYLQLSVEVSVIVRKTSSLILGSIIALHAILVVRLVLEAKILNVPLAIPSLF